MNIHATARAIAIVRNRGDNADAQKAPPDARACDGAGENFQNGAFYAGAALMFLDNKDLRVEAALGHAFADVALPTCPLCRVLLDQALDSPDAKPLDFTGAP